MKISQKQAELLAGKVLKQLKKEKVNHVSDLTKAKIEAFLEERQKLVAAYKAAEDALDKHDDKFDRLTGVPNIRVNQSLRGIIEDIQKKNFPSLSQITDEIILSAMFNTSDDLEVFIDKIAKVFVKNPKVIQ